MVRGWGREIVWREDRGRKEKKESRGIVKGTCYKIEKEASGK